MIRLKLRDQSRINPFFKTDMLKYCSAIFLSFDWQYVLTSGMHQSSAVMNLQYMNL